MGFEDEAEQSFGRPCRQSNGRIKRTHELTSSIVPRGTSFHRFSNRPFGVKRFQTIHHHSVDVARGLVLLFGIGTRALPSCDSKTRRNNLLVGLAVSRTAGSSGLTNSPHPSSREGHPSTASLIGRLGSSAFRLSTTTVSMSLAGSCFSSESAPGPFHHGIRRRGGTIFWSALPSVERQDQADSRTHLIHRPARDILPPLGGSRFSSIGFDPKRFSCCCRGLLPGPSV